jgi:hypothetical protein
MHASLWRFKGDPDELLARYRAMLAETPGEKMRLPQCATDSTGGSGAITRLRSAGGWM